MVEVHASADNLGVLREAINRAQEALDVAPALGGPKPITPLYAEKTLLLKPWEDDMPFDCRTDMNFCHEMLRRQRLQLWQANSLKMELGSARLVLQTLQDEAFRSKRKPLVNNPEPRVVRYYNGAPGLSMDGIDGIIDGIDGMDAMDGTHAHGMHSTHGN